MKPRTKAFTLVEIMIVVAIIGILIAIAVPGFIRAREVSRRNSCQENLQKIDGAKSQWALEKNKAGTDTPTWDDLIQAGQTGYLRYKAICPLDDTKTGATYAIEAVNSVPTCTKGVDEFTHTFPQPASGS